MAIAKLTTLLFIRTKFFSLEFGRKTNRRKGYLESLILNQGKIDKEWWRFVSTREFTLWIFAHSLKITERHRHSFDVFPDVNRKVPFGAGATLYLTITLISRVKNTTENTFRIRLWIENDYLL